jgi:hypothetical protein
LEVGAAPRLRVARLHGALPQEVQLVLLQAALQSQQEPIITLPRGVDRVLVNQEGIDDPTDLNQLLPLPAVARKAGDLPRGHGPHLAQADLRHHALEAGTRHRPGGRSAQVLIHDLDLAPPQLSEPVLHGVLQLLALQVVGDLVGRLLAHVEHGFARHVLRLHLVTHGPPPGRRGLGTSRAYARAAGGPATAPSCIRRLAAWPGWRGTVETAPTAGPATAMAWASASPRVKGGC